MTVLAWGEVVFVLLVFALLALTALLRRWHPSAPGPVPEPEPRGGTLKRPASAPPRPSVPPPSAEPVQPYADGSVIIAPAEKGGPA